MVNVGVRQDDMVNFGRLYARIPVFFVGGKALALKTATVEQDLLAGISSNQVFASGNFAGGPKEFDFHDVGFSKNGLQNPKVGNFQPLSAKLPFLTLFSRCLTLPPTMAWASRPANN